MLPPKANKSKNFCHCDRWKSNNHRESNQEKKQRNYTSRKVQYYCCKVRKIENWIAPYLLTLLVPGYFEKNIL